MNEASADFFDQWRRQGVESDFEKIFSEYYRDIFKFLKYLTGDHSTAEDLLQETFLRLHCKREKIGKVDNPKAYLRRIAYNVFCDFLTKKEQKINKIDWERIPAERLWRAVALKDPLQELQKTEVRERVRRAIDVLPRSLREPLILCAILGFSYDESAKTLDTKPGIIKSRVYRAKGMLRAKLGSEE